MRFPKFRCAVLCGATLGVVIPLVVMSLFWLHVFDIAGAWLFYIWPTSIMLMVTETLGHSPQAFAILAWSIAWNVLLYVIIFIFLWSLGWVAWVKAMRQNPEAQFSSYATAAGINNGTRPRRLPTR